MKQIKYFFEFIIISFLFLIYKVLGLKISSFLSGKLFEIFGPFFRSKETIRSNIQRAIPQVDLQELNKIKKSMWNNYGRTLAEYMFLKSFRNNKLTSNINLEGKEISYDEAKQKTFQILSMQLTPIGGSETPLLAVRLDLTETHADIYGFLYNAYGTPLAAATDLGLAHIKNIGSANIIDGSVVASTVGAGAIVTAGLGNGAATTAKIGANAVTIPSSVFTAGTVTRAVNDAVLTIASIQFTVGATANIVLHLYFVPEINDADATPSDFTYILKRGSTTIQTQSLTIHHNSEDDDGGNIVPSSTPFISGTFVDASVGAGNYTYTLSIGGTCLGASKRAFAATAAMK